MEPYDTQVALVDVLFLFSITDYASKPWLDAGFTVMSVDTQHHSFFSTKVHRSSGGAHYKTNCRAESLQEVFKGLKPALVIAFPPCTDLAVSGAAHFKKKLERNPGFQEEAVALCRIAETFDCPYMIENPVSVLSTLWRKPDHIFHPWEYGGYIGQEHGEHPDYPEHIAPFDAYPKKTCLWTSEGFTMPAKHPVKPEEGYSRQHNKLGGSGMKTKNIRSASPRGFFIGVFLANVGRVAKERGYSFASVSEGITSALGMN
jgi:hypothetical protein